MSILQMMMQAMMSGQSPQQFFAHHGQDPQVAQIANVMQGKTYDQQMETVGNMAQQRGMSLDALAKQMGIPYKR